MVMELDEALLSLPINPNNFPAKLWRLVNSPLKRSIRWDSRGDGIIIDQQMFEAELLSPSNKQLRQSPDLFKTTNFASFIRQLNLYGFRKIIQADKQSKDDPVTDGIQHHFHNSNFKQGHPELLIHLKRLTSSNKAKIEAGIEVNCRPPNRLCRLFNSLEENSAAEVKGSVVVGQTLRGLPRENAAAYQYHLDGSRQKESDRASIPPNAWIMGSGDVSSATTFYTDRGVPVSLIRRFPTDSCMIQSNPTSGIMQHGSQNISAIGQKFTHTFIPHHSQYRTGFFAPVCHGCIPDSLDSDMSCSHHPPASYYNYGFCPTYSVGCLQPSGPDLDLKAGDGLEPKKSDVNLDTVFKIVDELQGSPRVCFAKVTTPEKSLSSPPASSSYNPTGSALRSTSAPALRQHTVRSPSPRVRPTPVDGTVVAVPGKDAPSSQPETGTKRRLEQRPSKAEEATVGSSTKAAGAAMADLSEEQARG